MSAAVRPTDRGAAARPHTATVAFGLLLFAGVVRLFDPSLGDDHRWPLAVAGLATAAAVAAVRERLS